MCREEEREEEVLCCPINSASRNRPEDTRGTRGSRDCPEGQSPYRQAVRGQGMTRDDVVTPGFNRTRPILNTPLFLRMQQLLRNTKKVLKTCQESINTFIIIM